MAWFIVEEERITQLKFIIEADNEEEAFELVDKWDYLGYVDGDTTESNTIAGPFRAKAEALDDIVSYVEG